VILATYTWSASANGNANVASNWTPNGVPTAGDTVQFAGNVPYECTWNIAEVSIMDIQAGFTGSVKFATNCIIATGLSINEERRINPSAPVAITFNGTPAYHSNLAYVKLNCADMVAEDGLFDNLQFNFAGSTRTTIDAGKYPHMIFKAGFRTDYITPSFSANKYNVEMKSISIGGGNVSAPSSPSADDRLMNWTITSTGSHNGGANQFSTPIGSPALFDGGAGTWTFQAKSSGFTFPVTGSPIYNDWTFAFENVIIDGTANGSGGFVGVIAGAIVRLTNLTINSGCSMKGSDVYGATIHLVNRPTIKGTWGFLPIADGIYYYKGIYNLGVSGGGTGLVSIASGAIPYGFTSQKLGTDGTFNFNDATGTLTIGQGGMIITTGVVGSPLDNQLWVHSTSGALMFGSSAVGSGGGGGGMTSFTVAGSSGSSQTITDGNTLTIAQGTGITSVASATDTLTITNTGVTSNVAGTGITVSGATGAVTIGCDLEGTELKSTGETSGSKFLRENGDGTCSWQTVSGGSGGITVKDEGVALTTTATTLNFVDGLIPVVSGGTGNRNVFATGTGAEKTITIDGSKLRISSSDLIPSYLSAKILQGNNMSITLDTTSAASIGHQLSFAANNDKVKTSSSDSTEDYLVNKLVAGTGITLVESASGSRNITIASSGGGYPLFRHDQAPTANNFSPFRLLANGDTIQLGLSTGSGKNTSVFTPQTDTNNPVIVNIDAIGAVGTNTGREYIFYGQSRVAADSTNYVTIPLSATGAYPTYFVESMRDVPVGGGVFFGMTLLQIFSGDGVNNVRVIDAGEHQVMNGSQVGGHPDGEPENPSTVRILLIADYQLLDDGRGRFIPNYRLRPSI